MNSPFPLFYFLGGKMKKKDLLFYSGLVMVVALFFLGFIALPTMNSSDRFYIVVSGSMEPTLHVGDVVFVKEVNPWDIRKGDIITFKRNGHKVTHRCVNIIEDKKNWTRLFVTKGDANEDPDLELVCGNDLIGRVPSVTIFGKTFYFKIPYLGCLSWFVQTIWGYIFLIVIPCLILIGISTYEISILFFTKDK